MRISFKRSAILSRECRVGHCSSSREKASGREFASPGFFLRSCFYSRAGTMARARNRGRAHKASQKLRARHTCSRNVSSRCCLFLYYFSFFHFVSSLLPLSSSTAAVVARARSTRRYLSRMTPLEAALFTPRYNARWSRGGEARGTVSLVARGKCAFAACPTFYPRGSPFRNDLEHAIGCGTFPRAIRRAAREKRRRWYIGALIRSEHNDPRRSLPDTDPQCAVSPSSCALL